MTESLQRRNAERAPAIEKEMAQLAAEQQRCRQEGKRVLQAIGGEAPRSEMTTKRLAELDERDHQLDQRIAELRDELAAVQHETVSAAQAQRAVALYDGQHEGIVDEKLFGAVQSTLNRSGPSGKGARHFRQDFLLRGLLRCR